MTSLEIQPHPSAIIQSLRSVGYTPATALADLVDNSISAGASAIQIRVSPNDGIRKEGFVAVEDNGRGMVRPALLEAMRWGGQGPTQARAKNDLGRFGLGMKTASFSLGRTLSVATRSMPKGELSVLRWDLDEVAKTERWSPTEGLDSNGARIFHQTCLASDETRCGTVIIISGLDRLNVKSAMPSHASSNEAALFQAISSHLGMVFHHFIANGVTIRLGSSNVRTWSPIAGGSLRDSETFGNGVQIASYVMPHHSKLTTDEFDAMGGPLGWQRHQGFLIYRAGRLIVPGGWLRLFRAEESCKLARIAIHLSNDLDETWGLNVMKSTVIPPSWIVADLKRIGDATRRQAKEVYNFRGEREAPGVDAGPLLTPRAFWTKSSSGDEVRFRINRAHPVVQTLMLSISDTRHGQAFLTAFERLLPLDAILQDPKKTTNGSGHALDTEELRAFADLAKAAIQVLGTQGMDRTSASDLILSSEPFIAHATRLRALL